jgi:1,4-dihydroxy-6-naphthoate synthase
MRDQGLTIAYTPDSDDAFYYFALETGRVRIPGWLPAFERRPMSILNRLALDGTYHITAISSVLYPRVADRYAVLSVGSSVGRGYGPVLVARQPCDLSELRGRRIGVGGVPTTGWFLLRRICPDAVVVEMEYDRIGEAVATGELDAGVMIHEELLYYPQLGLHRVLDLGAAWCRETGLPLPVGLNVIRRDLGLDELGDLCSAVRRSLLYGMRRRPEALAWVRRFGRGSAGRCTTRFVEMFANDDSVSLPLDARQGLHVLLGQVVEQGLADAVPPLLFIEGARSPIAQGA